MTLLLIPLYKMSLWMEFDWFSTKIVLHSHTGSSTFRSDATVDQYNQFCFLLHTSYHTRNSSSRLSEINLYL